MPDRLALPPPPLPEGHQPGVQLALPAPPQVEQAAASGANKSEGSSSSSSSSSDSDSDSDTDKPNPVANQSPRDGQNLVVNEEIHNEEQEDDNNAGDHSDTKKDGQEEGEKDEDEEDGYPLRSFEPMDVIAEVESCIEYFPDHPHYHHMKRLLRTLKRKM